MGFRKRPVEYDWTGSDVLVEVCPQEERRERALLNLRSGR